MTQLDPQSSARQQRRPHAQAASCSAVAFWTAAFLLATLPATSLAQSQPVTAPSASPAPQQAPAQAAPAPSAQPTAAPASSTASPSASDDKESARIHTGDRRRAAKLFLEASKLFEKEKFEEAQHDYERAASLDPTNRNYSLAAGLAASHEVTALIQAAAKDRIRGDAVAERTALEHALAIDPKNIQVTEHLHELGDDAAREVTPPLYRPAEDLVAGPLRLDTTDGPHSFHIHSDQRTVIQQVFKAYGLQATIDQSVRLNQVRMDMDDANFAEATRALGLVTNSFYVPLDAHRVLVVRETAENRREFERLDFETIYLPGLSPNEMTEISTVARTVYEFQHATVDPTAATISVRAPTAALDAFNATVRDLVDGHNQVMLEVSLIQLAHTSDRNTGVQPPQSITAFNVYAQEQSILNANQSLVQQIISSGLAAPGDTLAILGILLASGQVSSSIFSNGIALFGGGITQSALSPGPATLNLNLNSSDSRELEHMMLRLSDGNSPSSDAAAGTIKSGTRYPIQTSSFSSLSAGTANIPGLTGAGTSSSLSSLLGSLGSSVPNVPQVEYQDLGLTLKATPKVMRNDDVALNVDLKIDALSGTSINGNPILTSRSYSGVVTLKKGEGVVVVSELDKQESRAVSGVPGLSEVPGLNDITDKDVNRAGSSLLIVMTPHVVRSAHASGHSVMMRVERGPAAR